MLMYIFSYPDLMESQKLAFKGKNSDLLFAANNKQKSKIVIGVPEQQPSTFCSTKVSSKQKKVTV